MLANRILIRQILARKRFTDYDLVRFVHSLVGIKGLSAQQRDSQRREILRVHPPHDRVLTLPLRERWMLRDPETAVPAVALPGHRSDKSGSLDARQRAHAFQQRFKEIYTLRGLSVLRLRQSEPHGEHVICDATEIRGPQPLVTLQQQACTDEQNDRKPHFQRKQPFAQADSRRPRAV